MKINKTVFLTIVTTIAIFSSCKEDNVVKPTFSLDFTASKVEITVGDTITFTDLSLVTPDATGWHWAFEGGTPSESILQNPLVSYEKPGTYNVELMVTTEGEVETTVKEGFIKVNPGPVSADFSADKTEAEMGSDIVFTDLSAGAPTSWSWEFIPGSGTTITSTEQNPVVTFSSSGLYTVKLTISNGLYSDEKTKTDYINILNPDSADFSSNVITTYTGGPVTFNSKEGFSDWNWTFEGGTPATSTEENPQVTYNTVGKYKVTLTATKNNFTSTKEKDAYIIVIPGNGLEAYYPFNGNAEDESGNSYNATAGGEGTVAYGTDRNENGCAVFDGASFLLTPSDVANFGTTDFSVSYWIKTAEVKKMMIFQKGGKDGGGHPQAWSRMGDNQTTNVIRFLVGGVPEMQGDPASVSVNVSSDDIGGANLANDQWHHVVCVKEGQTVRMYIDNVMIKESTNTGSAKSISSDEPFRIGAQEGTTGYQNYFTGSIDDVIIYNRALSASDVEVLYGL